MAGVFSIASGESRLVFERVGETYVPRVYLGEYQEAPSPLPPPSQGGGMAMDGAHFITLWAGDVESPARITRVSGQDVLEFEVEFPGLPDWRLVGNVMVAGAGRVRLRVEDRGPGHRPGREGRIPCP